MGNDIKRPADSKYRPPEVKDRSANKNGDGKDFNIKGKVTNNGGDYNSFARDSGLYGNFAEKDASLEYLRERNKQGQVVKNFNATQEQARLLTGAGVTAYDALPIPEVYHPATSQGPINPNAVIYNYDQKDRHEEQPYTQDTESDELTRDQTKHLKSKE